MKTLGEMSGFGTFFWEFGGGSSNKREIANQRCQARNAQSSPVFTCFHHSINVLCIYLAMHIKTTTDVTSTCDMAPGFMGASNMTRDRIYTDMINSWV